MSMYNCTNNGFPVNVYASVDPLSLLYVLMFYASPNCAMCVGDRVLSPSVCLWV